MEDIKEKTADERIDQYNKEKYERIIFSIRMLKFHNFITETQFRQMFKKLEKLIEKEENMTFEQALNYIDLIW